MKAARYAGFDVLISSKRKAWAETDSLGYQTGNQCVGNTVLADQFLGVSIFWLFLRGPSHLEVL